jgi:hypothetical protein
LVNRAVRVFEEAGAHVEEVKLGIKRSHKELTDAWSGLYMLLNLQAYENMKRDGIDLLGQYRKDFPPQYLEWVEKAKRLSGLVTPTTACPPVDNANDGNTVGPSSINGVEIDPLVGWAMTYFGIGPGRAIQRPADRDADHWPAKRRYRCAGGERRVRAASAWHEKLQDLPGTIAASVRPMGPSSLLQTGPSEGRPKSGRPLAPTH